MRLLRAGDRWRSVVRVPTLSRGASALVVAICATLSGCSGEPGGAQPEMPDPPEPPSRPVPCIFVNATCAERIALGDGLLLPAYTTHQLTTGDAGVTRGLIVVHGNNRDPDAYFESGLRAVANGGVAGNTIVVAPHFQTSDDLPEANEPFWSSAGWKRGHLSRPEGPVPRVSSYAALERILELLLDSNRFPAIRQIVVTGHSAGGQVVHRFAATSGEEEQARAGVELRYVVANPSTYLYLGPEREWPDGTFIVPGAGCDDYNDWHYGLSNRNTYAGGIDADTLSARLVRRDVRILVGDADTLSASLDVSCGANLQGANRFVRGRTLVRFMTAYDSGHAHTEMIVPGVGHSSRSMWLSEVGRSALFGN